MEIAYDTHLAEDARVKIYAQFDDSRIPKKTGAEERQVRKMC